MEFADRIWREHRQGLMRTAVIIAVLLAQPRSNILFLLGLVIALLGQAFRTWALGQPVLPGMPAPSRGPWLMSPRPDLIANLVMALGFAAAASNWRDWFSSAVIWTGVWAYWRWPLAEGFGEQPKLPVFDRFKEAWDSSTFSAALALSRGEKARIAWFSAALFFLRFKMVYRL